MTSLIQHERISTTVAKAKETQREAEKIVTKAKRALVNGKVRQRVSAEASIYDNATTMPLLRALAERYRERPGGYTRLHLHGSRPGDHAPRALLEFVDRPGGDLKLELTAMSMARETFLRVSQLGKQALDDEVKTLGTQPLEMDERFHPLTRTNAEKVIKFRGQEGRDLLITKARAHFYRLLATREVEGDWREDKEAYGKLQVHAPRGGRGSKAALAGHRTAETVPMAGQRRLAGMRRDILQSGPAEPVPKRADRGNSVIRIGKGAFARRQSRRVWIPSSSDMAFSSADAAADAPAAEEKFAR